jgi:acyl carrier protein
MLMNDEIAKQVRAALVQTLKLPSEGILKPGTKLKEELGLDSMSSLTFLMTLEDLVEGFAVDPDSLESSHLETVETVAGYIMQELTKKEQMV